MKGGAIPPVFIPLQLLTKDNIILLSDTNIITSDILRTFLTPKQLADLQKDDKEILQQLLTSSDFTKVYEYAQQIINGRNSLKTMTDDLNKKIIDQFSERFTKIKEKNIENAGINGKLPKDEFETNRLVRMYKDVADKYGETCYKDNEDLLDLSLESCLTWQAYNFGTYPIGCPVSHVNFLFFLLKNTNYSTSDFFDTSSLRSADRTMRLSIQRIFKTMGLGILNEQKLKVIDFSGKLDLSSDKFSINGEQIQNLLSTEIKDPESLLKVIGGHYLLLMLYFKTIITAIKSKIVSKLKRGSGVRLSPSMIEIIENAWKYKEATIERWVYKSLLDYFGVEFKDKMNFFLEKEEAEKYNIIDAYKETSNWVSEFEVSKDKFRNKQGLYPIPLKSDGTLDISPTLGDNLIKLFTQKSSAYDTDKKTMLAMGSPMFYDETAKCTYEIIRQFAEGSILSKNIAGDIAEHRMSIIRASISVKDALKMKNEYYNYLRQISLATTSLKEVSCKKLVSTVSSEYKRARENEFKKSAKFSIAEYEPETFSSNLINKSSLSNNNRINLLNLDALQYGLKALAIKKIFKIALEIFEDEATASGVTSELCDDLVSDMDTQFYKIDEEIKKSYEKEILKQVATLERKHPNMSLNSLKKPEILTLDKIPSITFAKKGVYNRLSSRKSSVIRNAGRASTVSPSQISLSIKELTTTQKEDIQKIIFWQTLTTIIGGKTIFIPITKNGTFYGFFDVINTALTLKPLIITRLPSKITEFDRVIRLKGYILLTNQQAELNSITKWRTISYMNVNKVMKQKTDVARRVRFFCFNLLASNSFYLRAVSNQWENKSTAKQIVKKYCDYLKKKYERCPILVSRMGLGKAIDIKGVSEAILRNKGFKKGNKLASYNPIGDIDENNIHKLMK